MRKIYTIAMLLAMIFVSGMITAQDVLVVEPTDDLATLIDTHKGDKIYQLKAGEWYGLSKPIENVDFHLQIIGEPYDDDTMPATLQTGQTGDLTPFAAMFTAKGNITLKDIYFVNADLTGQIGRSFLVQSDSGSFVNIDNCIIDPIGEWSAVEMTGGDNDLTFTNNQAFRHGHMAGANDGHCFIIAVAAASLGADSVIFENNTFVDMGMNWLSADFAAHVTSFLLINHNTFVRSKSQMDWSILEDEYYLTNNLFFDFQTGGYGYHWQPMPGGDASMPKPMLIYADTIADEVLPSTRIQYIQYNNLYRDQKFYDLIAEMNVLAADSLPHVNLHPLIWDGLTPAYFGADPAEAFADSREGHLFNHANNVNTDFPNWKYGNTVYDHDPQFTDPMIYNMSDSLAAWASPANYIHVMGRSPANYPPISEWAQWHWDPDGDVSINGTWPVFDGTYADAATMTGSVANLPLGDLNWYPEKKATWEMYKEDIFAHMKAGNTEKWGSIGVGPAIEAGSFSRVYPNPMSYTSLLEFTLDTPSQVRITIYNSLGQEVRSVLNEMRSSGTHTLSIERGDLNHGLYFYSIKAGNIAETQKLLILE
ncbi:MAG: T9SS type A sorting domain-containing protein [Bacteroidetes bacterium]|nr:T9SS type A sorting domain-containing protein [Bacteroidota bacterium]